MKKTKFNSFSVFLPIIIGLSIVAGALIAKHFLFAEINNQKGYSLYKENHPNKLNTVIDYVCNEYVDPVSLDSISEDVIKLFLEQLDPHSVYISSEEAQSMNEELEGNFEGIGVQFNVFKDTILVVKVIEKGPSARAGIMPGDRIVEVDDSIVAGVGIDNSSVIKRLKGPSNSSVKLKIYRPSEGLISKKIKRGSVALHSVDAYYNISPEIGYLKISNFARNTHKEFLNAVKSLNPENKLSGLIVDLRGNSGGYLMTATDIIDEFFEKGKMIVYTEGRSRKKRDIETSNSRKQCINTDIVILIDEFSASASEIFAGAIQDNDRGFVIGRRSYGKGLVQETSNFADGSIMRLTTARYYTPSGRSIQKTYSEGNSQYFSEIYERYFHGEFLAKDSISYNDSTKYYTEAGREVYGGGGIMPDIFIPMDTTYFSDLLSDIRKKSLIYSFATEYVDNNRSQLLNFENTDKLITKLEKDRILTKFWNFVLENGITINAKDKEKSSDYINNLIQSHICRQVLNESDFYMIINQKDSFIDTATNILKTKRKPF